jgi:hypothetical protein
LRRPELSGAARGEAAEDGECGQARLGREPAVDRRLDFGHAQNSENLESRHVAKIHTPKAV